MFELGKVVGWLLSPLLLALLLWGVALGLVSRGRWRLGVAAGLLGVASLWAIATPLLANILAHQLEMRFPTVTVEKTSRVDAIVVLGGALAGAHPPERPTFELSSASDRVWHAADLYRAGKAPWVMVSGGNQPGTNGIQVEADAIRSMLTTLGVPASAIRMEGRSRNTEENARDSAPLIQAVGAKRVLLVTSAMHMPRALRTFQAALRDSGVTVLPASTDVEGISNTLHPLGRWLPDADALALSTRALKEYLGLAWLEVRGF